LWAMMRVVLDLVQPLAAGRQLRDFGWKARRDEPGRQGTLQHAGQIKLCNSDCNQNRAVIWRLWSPQIWRELTAWHAIKRLPVAPESDTFNFYGIFLFSVSPIEPRSQSRRFYSKVGSEI
jgi:hypothetical protein